MDNKENSLLTQIEFMSLVIGCVLGPGFLKMASAICGKAKHDACISVIIGIIYPLSIIILGLFIIKKYPNDTILIINKKLFGNIIGTILNIAFSVQYIIINAAMISDVVRVFTTYLTAFLTPFKIVIVTTILALLLSLNGIKILAKVNVYTFYIAIVLWAVSVFALKKGNILNLQPFFSSGWSNILQGAIQTSYFYLGFESLLLYHPFVYDKTTIKKSLFHGLLLCSIIWIWVVFISIYQLGTYFILRAEWPMAFVLEKIYIPIINNFTYLFMFAWSLMVYRCISSYYYTCVFIFQDITKINIKKLCFIVFPIFVYLSMKFNSNVLKIKVVNIFSPLLVIFNMVLFSIIAILILIKNNKCHINKVCERK